MNRLQPSGPAQRQTDGRTDRRGKEMMGRKEEGVDQWKEGLGDTLMCCNILQSAIPASAGSERCSDLFVPDISA